MKPIYAHTAAALALTLATAACIPPAPRPTPPAQTRPAPAPSPTPTPAPTYSNWMDAPASEGDWSYRNEGAHTLALFGGAATEADFVMRCERGRREVELWRAGEAAGPVTMRVRTETAERSLTARADDGPLPYLVASLPAGDRLLDAMALSKGRFAIEVAGTPTLYLPSWAEVTRVIEDCR